MLLLLPDVSCFKEDDRKEEIELAFDWGDFVHTGCTLGGAKTCGVFMPFALPTVFFLPSSGSTCQNCSVWSLFGALDSAEAGSFAVGVCWGCFWVFTQAATGGFGGASTEVGALLLGTTLPLVRSVANQGWFCWVRTPKTLEKFGLVRFCEKFLAALLRLYPPKIPSGGTSCPCRKFSWGNLDHWVGPLHWESTEYAG